MQPNAPPHADTGGGITEHICSSFRNGRSSEPGTPWCWWRVNWVASSSPSFATRPSTRPLSKASSFSNSFSRRLSSSGITSHSAVALDQVTQRLNRGLQATPEPSLLHGKRLSKKSPAAKQPGKNEVWVRSDDRNDQNLKVVLIRPPKLLKVLLVLPGKR